MISAEILKTVRPENVKSLWPRIVDIDEAQAGGCTGFWNRYFPGEDPQEILDRCDGFMPDWSLFWYRICPAGQLRFVVAGAYGKGERQEGVVEEGCEYASGEEEDFAVRVLEDVVKGRLVSDDPSFFLRDGPDMVLIWPGRRP